MNTIYTQPSNRHPILSTLLLFIFAVFLSACSSENISIVELTKITTISEKFASQQTTTSTIKEDDSGWEEVQINTPFDNIADIPKSLFQIDKKLLEPERQIHGHPFTAAKAIVYTNGIDLYSSDEYSSQAMVKILFNHKPSSKRYTENFLIRDIHLPSDPQLTTFWKSSSSPLPQSITFSDNYELASSFGRANTDKNEIELKISLRVDDSAGTFINENIIAELATLPFNRTGIDLLSDTYEAAAFTAIRFLSSLHKSPIQLQTDLGFRIHKTDPLFPYITSGYFGLIYTVGDNTPRIARLQLVKDPRTGWRVFRQLNPNQLDYANPIFQPNANYKDLDFRILRTMFGKRLEHIFEENGSIYQVTQANVHCKIHGSLKEAKGIASCHASYGLVSNDTLECQAQSSLFRIKANVWVLEKEIQDNYRVNIADGDIESYTPSSLPCEYVAPE